MDLFDLFAKISIDISDYEHGLNQAQKKANDFAANLKNISTGIDKAYSGLGDLLSPAADGFKAVESVGKTAGNAIMDGLKGFTAISAAVGGFGAAAVKTGMNFDATMSEVSAISGATGQEFDNLRDKALEMGAKTQFSASEAAAAMTYMGMAGWKSGDMISGIEGIMNLAAASGEDLALTSDIVTDALTAFGKSAGDSGRLADIMAAASSNANTNVAMLGESFKYVAPVAGALGYSMEDTSLALGLMANSGIKASQAGTTLRTALTNMASPTKNMAAVMDTYGISLTNADGSMMSLQDVMIQLREKMGGLDEATQASAASMLFGKEAMSGMLAIINAAPEDFEKLTGAIYDCKGAAEEMAATMIDNLQGDLTLLGSAFESLQIAISDSLTPTFREFAQFGQKAMSNLLEGFQGGGVSGFMDALSSVVTEGVTMLAGKAPEFVHIGKSLIFSVLEGLLGAKEEILVAANKIMLDLTSAFVSIPMHYGEQLREFGIGIIELIASGFSRAGDAIATYIGDFIPLIAQGFLTYHETLFTVGLDILAAIGQGIIDNKDQLQSIASETITNMVTSLRDNAPMIIEGGIALLEALAGAIMENMPLILETGAEIIGQLVAGVTTSMPTLIAAVGLILPQIAKVIDVVGNIGGVVKNVVNLVTGGQGIGKVLSIGKTLMSGISKLFALVMAHPIVAVVGAIIAAVVLLWQNCEEFRDAVGAIWEAITGFFTAAWETIKGAWEGAGAFFTGIWEGISGAFSAVVEFFGGIFSDAWTAITVVWDTVVAYYSAIWDGIQEIFAVVAEVLGGFFTAAWEAIQTAWDVAVEFFSNIWSGIQEAFSVAAEVLGGFFSAAWDAITAVWDFAVEFFSGVWDGISGAFGAAAEWFGGVFSDAWSAVTSAWDGVTAFFTGVWDDITGVFGNVWERFSQIGGNIVDGIKDGIKGAWDAFTKWLNGLVGGIVDGVKAMLGIHSPSTVFAGIGENMALGLAEGWEDRYRGVKRVIEEGLAFDPNNNTPKPVWPNWPSGGGNPPSSRGGDTYNFYSPKALDPVSAAREMKKAKQQMALGYV